MKVRSILGLVLIVLLVGVGVMWVMLSHSRPKGVAGPAADALARKMQRAVAIDKWKKIGVVRWVFRGTDHLLWDRKRGLVRVRWGKGIEVLFRASATTPQDGIVKRNGKLLSTKRAKYLKGAFARWINHRFWLNPLARLFDKGTVRKLVKREGQEHLLVEYSSGGVTPGDAYFFLLGKDLLPKAWQMFVGIIPIKGVQISFEGWIKVAGGAKISTLHQSGLLKLKLTGIKAAADIKGLYPKADPFAALVGKTAPTARREASGAASRPAPRTPVTTQDAAPTSVKPTQPDKR